MIEHWISDNRLMTDVRPEANMTEGIMRAIEM